MPEEVYLPTFAYVKPYENYSGNTSLIDQSEKRLLRTKPV